MRRVKSYGLTLPDIPFIRQTLHTIGDICPACLKARNADDMVWLPNAAPATACCTSCLSKNEYARDIGLSRAMVESDDYVQSIHQAISPSRWLIKSPQKANHRGRLADICASIVLLNAGNARCDGVFTSVPNIQNPDFRVETYKPCNIARVRSVYFSRLGFTCPRCLWSSANGRMFQGKIDAKERHRAICEGMRYATYLAGLFSDLVELPRSVATAFPYSMEWIDWRDGSTVTTEHIENYPFGTVLRERVSKKFELTTKKKE